MICPHCGAATPNTLPECAHCGKSLQITADSVFAMQEDEGPVSDLGPKLVRYVVGLVVLAAVLWYGTGFLKGHPLVKNDLPEPSITLPEARLPQPKPPATLPEAELLEPLAVALPTALPIARPAFGSRDPRFRRLFLERNGGGADTEAAVKLGLDWLKSIQADDGSWDYKRFGVDEKYQKEGQDHRMGIAGLGLLAFLGAGHHHEAPGPYKEAVAKAVRYLLAQQNDQGQFPGTMYHQGICTMALAEAYGLSNDTSLELPTRKAIQAIVAAQTTTGGWDYSHRSAQNRSDSSVTGWQIMALKSARKVGIEFPDEVYTKAIDFLSAVSNDKGAIGYDVGGNREWRTSNALSAAGLNSYLFMGLEPTDPRVQKAVGILIANLPKAPAPIGDQWNPRADIYFWYHGALALSRLGGQEWTIWNDRVKPILLGLQDKKGDLKGSWRPAGTAHADRCGRVYVTALSIMALEVYYRYD